jgi:tight adherence protein B
MFGLEPIVLLFMALAMTAVGGISYVILFPAIERERNTDRRLTMVQREVVVESGAKTRKSMVVGASGNDAASRRKQLEISMKDADKKRKNRDQYMKKPPLAVQMRQAGLTTTVSKFYLYSVLFGIGLTVASIFLLGVSLIYAPAVFVVGALGMPRWFVARKRKKRVAGFLKEFPNALDVLVRAVKSGLPLNDGVRLLAVEAQEPVRTEFQRVVDGQAVGKSIPQACLDMQETMPSPEAAFFGIVIQIQAQAGGNLSEALGNLSKVLRDRKKMKAKVDALSMEAKASAAIIATLPFIVATLVYLSSPAYIMPLFTTSSGHMILGVSAVWMSIGVLVMKQMINFEM